ncbi:MAG: transcriptional regulator [Blastocatellia bacterium]|nr:transcriptional regulator [Blastocatellia bacterium]
MTVELDDRRYGRLLARERPHVIKTEEENDEVLERIAALMKKADGRSPEEDALLELLVALVERFEAEHYEIPSAAPHEVLEFLLEQRQMRPVGLVPILGSRGHVSDILTGRRKITAGKARELGAFFNVDPGLFV